MTSAPGHDASVASEARPQHRIDLPGGSWWQLSWQPDAGTFEAVHLVVDRYEREQTLAWHGLEPGEITSVDELDAIVAVPIPPAITAALAAEALHQPSTLGTVEPPAPADNRLGSGDPREWQDELTAWQARLESWEESLQSQGLEPRWSLPAAPATHVLRSILHEPAFSTADVEEFARGLNLDPDLTERLITGRSRELDLDEAAAICEGLHCSPYAVWGAEVASTILHAYGPDRWPSYIEPLNGSRHVDADDGFMRRRLDALAAEAVRPITSLDGVGGPMTTAGDRDEPATTVEATCFCRTAVLALDQHGNLCTVTDSGGPVEPAVEYHFRFQQLDDPRPLAVPLHPEGFAGSPPIGQDTHPVLAAAAQQLRDTSQALDVDLVRFVDPGSGDETWLGWDPEVASWQTWDDPRRYYPGDPADVLDPAGFDTSISSRDLELAPSDLDRGPVEVEDFGSHDLGFDA